MNKLDLVIIGIVLIFVVFGFFKKFHRNIFAVLTTIAAFPAAVFLEKTYYSSIMSANISILTSRASSGSIFDANNLNGIIDNIKSNSLYKNVLSYSPTLKSMADEFMDVITRLLVTYIIIILIVLLSGLVAYLLGAVFGIFIGKKGRKKKVLILSLPLSFVRGCAVSLIVLLPVVFLKPSLEACKDSNNESMQSAYSFYVLNIQDSVFLKSLETTVMDVFIDDEVDVDGVKSSTSVELGRGISIYNKMEPLITSFDSFTSATPSEYNDILDNIETKVNLADIEYKNLDKNSNYRKVIIEFINSGLANDTSGLLSDLSFKEEDVNSLKDDVLPSIMLRAFNQLLTDSGIDITLPEGMTYDQIMAEISNTNKMYLVANELNKIQNDDLYSIDIDSVVDGLKSFSSSSYTEELIDNLASQYTGDNAGVGVALKKISPETMSDEADEIGEFIKILQGTSNKSASEMVDTVSSSTVALELLKATDQTVPVSEEVYTDTMFDIESKSDLSDEDKAALKSFFEIEAEE